MPDIVGDGRERWDWVPAIANIAAPTTAELNAGIRISQWMTKDGATGFSPDTADAPTSSIESVFDTNVNGRVSSAQPLELRRIQALRPERDGEAENAEAREDRADRHEDLDGEENGEEHRDGAPHAAVDLGSGGGTTVRQLISVVEQVTGRTIRVQEAPRRDGDTAGEEAKGGDGHS